MASLLSAALRQTLRPFKPAAVSFRPPTARVLLAVRAMSTEGQMQSELMERMRTKIAGALEAQRVEVADVQGDGRHVEIMVVSKDFEGKSAVNRQRMVYKVRAGGKWEVPWRRWRWRCLH